MIRFPKYIFQKNNFFLVATGIILLTAFYTIFGRFFPNKHGCLGHDYSYFLPVLLDCYFWYKTNGLLEIPWFTPSFCGGSLNYANVQSCFYTLPQLFTIFTDPLMSVRLTVFLFAALGLLGFYLLLRRAFFFSRPVSLLGASLFLFNGFYIHRMLIGHFGDYSFMLLPFICFVLLRPFPSEKCFRLWQLLFDCLMGGILFAYMVQSGFGPYLIHVIISIVVVGLIHNLLFGKQWHFWLRWVGSGFVGILLCSSKLVAIFFLMESFPRSGYKLPGVRSFFEAAWLMLKSLFLSPAFDPGRIEKLTNVQWHLGRHEWEYSVTFIPLAIMLYGGWKILQQIEKKDLWLKLSRIHWLSVAAITALLILPVAVNTFSPGWNTFLKQLPLLKNSSSLIRWVIIYIPIVILAATLILEKIAISSKYKLGIIVISMAAVIALNALTKRDFYHSQNYDPEEIIKTYNLVKEGLWIPEIKNIGVYLNKNGQTTMPLFRNDMLIHGASQCLCYEALFGYRLEDFPIKTLHPGPALEENEGVLNIKNPSCYVWPEANNCEPGDHFTVEQKESAKAFLNYRPFPFQMPILQRIANWVNGLSLIAALFFLTLYGARAVIAFSRKKKTH
jgi:hypothetical protein